MKPNPIDTDETQPITSKIALRLIRRSTVQVMTGLSRSSLYAEMSKNRFPKSLRVGVRSVAWIHQEIEDWMHERIAIRDKNNKR